MLNVFDSEIYAGGIGNPARKFIVGDGYDPHNYIRTANLAPSPYSSQDLVVAKLGGLNRLIAAMDDSKPPIGTLSPNNPPNNPAYVAFNNLVQIVTTEINGYLSPVYPIPLMQTGTVCVLQVTALSTDGLNSVTGLDVVVPGHYLTAPDASQTPAYMRYVDPLAEDVLWSNLFGYRNDLPFNGSGLELTVSYAQNPFSDESGQVLKAASVQTVPVIVNGGANYALGDLLVLTGGASVVPAKVRQAFLEIFFYECYKRRLAPDEENPGSKQAEYWRKFLMEIQEGEKQLDGTYKRFYSASTSWNSESVLAGANSL